MKFRGTKITGSGVLTALGVVCFVAILVSAAVLTSGIIAFNKTTVTDPNDAIQLTKTEVASAYVGDPTTYKFTANVPDDLTGATLTVRVAEDGVITKSDLTSLSIKWNTGGLVSQTIPEASDEFITITYNIGDVTQGTEIPCEIVIEYAASGGYTVDVSLQGTSV